MSETKSNPLMVPVAIIIAGVLVAGAIVMRGGEGASTQVAGAGQGDDSFGNSLSGSAAQIVPVSDDDHVRGDPDASVTVVEFSDFECPFCARIHPNLTRLVEEYEGDVKWVYRHFPLTSIHSRAQGAAIASECVADLGGNDAFWSFADGLFENQGSLGEGYYKTLASNLGIDAAAFDACLNDPEKAEEVDADLADATNSGGRGTPYVVVVSEEGNTFPFSGALPYENIRQVVEQALADN